MPYGPTRYGSAARGREPDPYALLQVSQNASQEVINAAYRALARSLHPDVNRGEDATRLMRELNAAYAALSDPVSRAAYDARVRAREMRKPRLDRIQAHGRVLRAGPSAPASGGGGRAIAAGVGERPGRRALLVATLTLGMALVVILMLAFLVSSDGPDDRPLFTPSSASVTPVPHVLHLTSLAAAQPFLNPA